VKTDSAVPLQRLVVLLLTRQRSFDLMNFDRMRVVTTEIKKVVSEKRRIALRFSPQNILDGKSLVKVYKWI